MPQTHLSHDTASQDLSIGQGSVSVVVCMVSSLQFIPLLSFFLGAKVEIFVVVVVALLWVVVLVSMVSSFVLGIYVVQFTIYSSFTLFCFF